MEEPPALTIAVQTTLENSGGALKLKVVEVTGCEQVENLMAPHVVKIIESEPQMSVSISFL